MKIYRLSSDTNNHDGYSFYSSKKEAIKEKNILIKKYDSSVDIEKFEVEISKKGIIKALNIFASHPDNG